MVGVQKKDRGLRCIVVHLPTGIDLRLMEGDDFRRTELHKYADLAEIRSIGWKQALEERGGSEAAHSRNREECRRSASEV